MQLRATSFGNQKISTKTLQQGLYIKGQITGKITSKIGLHLHPMKIWNEKMTKSLPNSGNSVPRYTYIVDSTSVVCDKDTDVSIPGERSVDHPWCKAWCWAENLPTLWIGEWAWNTYKVVVKKFGSLPKKNTLKTVTTPRFALIFPRRVQHFWDARWGCAPKHEKNLETSNNGNQGTHNLHVPKCPCAHTWDHESAA